LTRSSRAACSASVSHLSAISMKSDLCCEVRAASANRMHSAALQRNWSKLGKSGFICIDMGTERAHRQRFCRGSHSAYSHSTLAGLYRAARVGLVTPLRDGMNLVAKEYVASQNPDDPGVLILSRFAGAAQECKAALLVNPYDPDSVAAAIGQALVMVLAAKWASCPRESGSSQA